MTEQVLILTGIAALIWIVYTICACVCAVGRGDPMPSPMDIEMPVVGDVLNTVWIHWCGGSPPPSPLLF